MLIKLYEAIGIKSAAATQEAALVNSTLAWEMLVAGLLIAFFVLVRMTLSVEKPRNRFSQTNPISPVTCRKRGSYRSANEPTLARGQAGLHPDPFTASGTPPPPEAAASRQYCTAGCDRP